MATAVFSAWLCSPPSLRTQRSLLVRDPLFWAGGAFLILLVIQWLNAGRQLIYNWPTLSWIYAPPDIAWLPGAVTKADAAEALRWFVPPWIAMLLLRHSLPRRNILVLYGGLVASGAVLAVAATLQWLAAQHAVLAIPAPADSYFVTSFGYMNHAGAYCVLLLAVSLGLFLRTFHRGHTSGWKTTTAWGFASFALFCGAHASESRSAICLAWLLSGLAVLLYCVQDWRAIPPVARLNRIASALGIACVVFFLVGIFGGAMLKREFVEELSRHSAVTLNTPTAVVSALAQAGTGGEREMFRTVALKIWRENPWFGGGLWAQRYFFALHLDPSEWSRALDEGAANVHTDCLQFLSEFGIVGFSLMGIAVLALALPVLRRFRELTSTPYRLIILCGIGVILAYSAVDLPFRSPAILLTWCVLLSGESMYWRGRKPHS